MPRKHRGLDPVGGRLLKGWQYTGGRLKNGFAEIRRVKRKIRKKNKKKVEEEEDIGGSRIFVLRISVGNIMYKIFQNGEWRVVKKSYNPIKIMKEKSKDNLIRRDTVEQRVENDLNQLLHTGTPAENTAVRLAVKQKTNEAKGWVENIMNNNFTEWAQIKDIADFPAIKAEEHARDNLMKIFLNQKAFNKKWNKYRIDDNTWDWEKVRNDNEKDNEDWETPEVEKYKYTSHLELEKAVPSLYTMAIMALKAKKTDLKPVKKKKKKEKKEVIKKPPKVKSTSKTFSQKTKAEKLNSLKNYNTAKLLRQLVKDEKMKGVAVSTGKGKRRKNISKGLLIKNITAYLNSQVDKTL